MAASASGIVVFLLLVLAGPLAWLIVWLKNRFAPSEAREAVADEKIEVTAQGESRTLVSGVDYLLSLLGYAIGIGNLWRFPYMVGKWGGCAFLVAYFICLFLVAIPAYLMEMVIGQYTRQGTIGCFKMIHPRWAGLGYCQALMLFFCIGYYNILLGYACIYIVGALNDPLPWAGDSANYWKHDVLNMYGDYDGRFLGELQWKLVVALLAVWIIVFVSVAFGKELLAKVTWVTVLGPCIMLVVLLIRSVSLDGAGDGVEFYIAKFDGDALGNLDMWAAACGQILFSLSPGMGTAITLSRNTKPKEDVVKTCIIVSLCNSAFSFIGGFAIFSIVGNIAYRINEAGGSTTVAAEAKAGPGLAFIVIADGMRTFGDGTNAMAVIFFMVLLTLGLDSTFAWVETFIAYVDDALKAMGCRVRYEVVTGVTCVVFFLTGLPYCTRMGNELLDTIDHYCVSYILLLGVALEAFMLIHSFGWRRLVVAVKRATLGNVATPRGRDMFPEYFWQGCYVYTVTLMPIFLFFYTLSSDFEKAYEGYPDWMQGVGWASLILTLLCLALGTIFHWKEPSKLPSMPEEEESLKAVQKAAGFAVTNIAPDSVGVAVHSSGREMSI